MTKYDIRTQNETIKDPGDFQVSSVQVFLVLGSKLKPITEVTRLVHPLQCRVLPVLLFIAARRKSLSHIHTGQYQSWIKLQALPVERADIFILDWGHIHGEETGMSLRIILKISYWELMVIYFQGQNYLLPEWFIMHDAWCLLYAMHYA